MLNTEGMSRPKSACQFSSYCDTAVPSISSVFLDEIIAEFVKNAQNRRDKLSQKSVSVFELL